MTRRIALTKGEYIANELEHAAGWNGGKLDDETIDFIAFILKEAYDAGYSKAMEAHSHRAT